MFVKRAIGVAIVLFWCLMNALLVRRELWNAPQPIPLSGGEKLTEPMEEWWAVFHGGEKIGYATQTITPKADGYEIQDYSMLHLQLLGTTQIATIRAKAEVNSEWILKRFDFRLQSSNMRFSARGHVSPGKLSIETLSAGQSTSRDIPLSQPTYVLAALKPYIATQQLEPRKEYRFWTFDPATLSQQVTTIVIEGREHIRIGDRDEATMRVRQQLKGVSVVSWLDGRGRTLKEESPAGLSLIRQNPEEARILSPRRSIPLDLIAQASIPSDVPIPEPDRKHMLKLQLSGFDLANFALSGGRQRLDNDRLEITRERLEPKSAVTIPVADRRVSPFLQATPFMQSDHPQIRALAQSILGREQNGYKAAVLLKDWVYRSLAKEPTVSIPNALEVLQSKKGDCNEHTVLFNALARAAGLPART
ncbi:MAG TPA: transglutaminase-like domain-containing protein, partial [Candidatus Acidoferrales bacterium]|nr:transglutaminase-like domain-containing protein [Candidatus Acidoferrales bacterium]